jgi:hypothetical protein
MTSATAALFGSGMPRARRITRKYSGLSIAYSKPVRQITVPLSRS